MAARKPPPPSPRTSPAKQNKLVKGAWDYETREAGELSFQAGEIITVTAEHPSGWWFGECNGRTGTFPSNYTEPYEPPTSTPAPAPTPSPRASVTTPRATGDAGGGGNPLDELRNKLAKRSEGPTASPSVTPRESATTPRSTLNKSPAVEPAVKRAPIETGATGGGVSAAKAAVAGKFAGLPAPGTPSPSLVKPPNVRTRSGTTTELPSFPAPAKQATSLYHSANYQLNDSADSVPDSSDPPSLSSSQTISITSSAESIPTETFAVAIYDYTAANEGELSFVVGDRIKITSQEEAWWQGELDGTVGWLSPDFIQVEAAPEEDKGPSIAERLAEVGSTKERLATPKKAVRTGRRPPTRGKKAGHAVKSCKTDTDDAPADVSSRDEPSSVPKSSPGPARVALFPEGGPTRIEGGVARSGLRKTAAPSTIAPITAAEPVDFRAGLRKSGNTIPADQDATEAPAEGLSVQLKPVVKDAESVPTPTNKLLADAKKPANSSKSYRVRPTTGAKVGGGLPQTPSPSPAAGLASRLKPVIKTEAPPPPLDETPVEPEPVVEPEPSEPEDSSSASTNDRELSFSSEKPVKQIQLPGPLGDYSAFVKTFESLFNSISSKRTGGVAANKNYLRSKEGFGASICTVGGVKYSLGSSASFTLQQTSFPFLYAVAASELKDLNNYFDNTPANLENPFSLSKNKIQNPLSEAGGLLNSSKLFSSLDFFDKSEQIAKKLSQFAASPVGSNLSSFISLKKHNYNNKSLAYWLKENTNFFGDIEEGLDLFFQAKSSFVSCEQLAVMGATLTNNGVNPISNLNVVSSDAASKTINLMNSCSLGTGSKILNLPGHGGESGCLFVVVPNVGSFAVYHPALNDSHVSAKAVELVNQIKQEFSL